MRSCGSWALRLHWHDVRLPINRASICAPSNERTSTFRTHTIDAPISGRQPALPAHMSGRGRDRFKPGAPAGQNASNMRRYEHMAGVFVDNAVITDLTVPRTVTWRWPDIEMSSA